MLKIIALALVCLSAGGAFAAELDGTRWSMRFKPMQSLLPLWSDARLVFDRGRLEYDGFDPASYEVLRSSGELIWRAELSSRSGGHASFAGTEVAPGRMDGLLTWTEAEKTPKEYRWTAELSAEGASP